MSNVIIIGSGPAGISSALYTQRGNIETTVISKGMGALEKAKKIENYYGVYPFVTGEQLYINGMESAKNIGVRFIDDEVTSLTYTDKLVVTGTNGSYSADAVILATGATRNTPKINGIKDFEGKGVSYCAICDAFFYRGKDVAVLGNGSYALNEAAELLNVANSVTVLTNGLEVTADFPSQINIISKPIQALIGDLTLNSVVFSDNTAIKTDGLFVAMGVAGSTDLARKLGAITENNKIVVDQNMATNVPGLYAAGDCTAGLLQVSKAVYEGAVAGTQVIKYVRGLK